ncbi:molybdate ABC transporter substrate-binding protein [Candidatus Leptofilum sp.]|uniref:molybdate ABC transporter substrate-binding protein n=1 Tax=Candidatus Leptofilum sp. TaxID=3241576 RepID=UPI003B5AA645
MKSKPFIFGLLAILLASCGPNRPTAAPKEITVFAAASLTDAFNELAETFEAQHDGVRILLNFAGSSQLAAQLREGAVADLFASANPAQMQTAVEAGRIAAGSETLFVANQLTLIVPVDNPAGIVALEDLAQPGVQLILAVEGVPVRQYSDEIIASLPAELQPKIYANLVSEEDNVRQIVAKIALGEADAGLVYTSDVTPDIASQVQQIPISAAQNVVASYLIAPLADAPSPELAQAFIVFVLSDEGQAILGKWGFDPP